MPKDSEAGFFDFAKGLAALGTAAFEGVATAVTLASASARRASQEADRRKTLSLLNQHHDTAEVYKANLSITKAAGFPDLKHFMESFYTRYCDDLDTRGTRFPVFEIRDAILLAAGELYAQERLDRVPVQKQFTDPIQEAEYRDEMLARLKKVSSPETLLVIDKRVREAFLDFTLKLPRVAIDFTDEDADDDPTQPTISLLDVLPNVGELLDALILPLYSPDVIELGLFSEVRAAIQRNADDASARLKVHIGKPSDHPGSSSDVVVDLLGGTVFAKIFTARVPFTLPDEQRFAGHWIIAPPGRGKTTLLHTLVTDDFEKDAAVILMDSKGDLIEPIKNLAVIKDRLLLIEPNPDAAFALNPLDISHSNVMQAVGLIEYIMAGLLDAKFTALQSTLFRNVVPAIIEAIPNPTLDTFKEVMVRGLPNLEKLNPHARQFFENRETGFHSKTYDSTRKEVVWRLDYLLTNPVMRSMFSATHTRLDLGKEMDTGKVIIINNSKAILGDEGAEFFGRFFVALIARAAQQRSGKPAATKKPCYVYIDECQSVIAKDTRIPILLDECRSQKIALVLAHQRTAQLTPPVLDAVANCAIRMANSDDEAKYLSSKLRMDAQVLQSLPRGTFGAFVRDLTPQGIQLKVSKVDFDALPKMTDADSDAIRARMKTDFASTPPSTSDTSPPAAPAAQHQGTKAAPASESTTSDAETPSPDDPGEPADKW
jgi:hypothetical protein